VFMVMLLTWLAILFVIVCAVSYFWFVVLGFKNSALWGFGLLLFQPITTIVYAIKHWDQARRPTWVGLTGMVGWVACFVFMILIDVSSATEFAVHMEDRPAFAADDFRQIDAATADEMDAVGQPTEADWEGLRQQIVAEIATDDDAALELREADDLPADALPSAADAEAHVDLGAFLPTVGRRSADGYLTVSLGEADRYVGDVAKLVQTNGREYRGLLAAANKSRVLMEKPMGGGTFIVEFAAREIESLSVLPKP